MALNIRVKFEKKLTCAFKYDIINLVNFHQNIFESLKLGSYVLTMILNSTGELCVMEMNNDAKFEEELTCQLKLT